MKKMFFLPITALILIANMSVSFGQTINLQQFLKEKKLITYNQNVIPITDGDRKGLSVERIAWLKDFTFSKGTIDIDLRGKNVFQQSFLGIAFHGVDSVTYDAVYFRPFNFRAEDPVRKIHAVQYVSEPESPWHRLREEQNGIYEKAVNPAPVETDWFHARIEVKDTEIIVYVNYSTTPSLTVPKLNDRRDGMIGLWNVGLNGDFANLVIKKSK